MSVTDETTQRASDRAAVLERFAWLIAGADTATGALTQWCGQPPCTLIHAREEAVALPDEGCPAGSAPHDRRAAQVHHASLWWHGAVRCPVGRVARQPAVPPVSVDRLRHGGESLGEVLGPLGLRRHTIHVNRLFDYGLPVDHDDDDRPVLLVAAALHISGERVALVKETYLEPVLFSGTSRDA